jgi:hypothetical protein
VPRTAEILCGSTGPMSLQAGTARERQRRHMPGPSAVSGSASTGRHF